MQSEPGDSQSQWAGVTDPDGAAFGLIAAVAGNPDDGMPVERLGRIAWLSLNAPDAKLSQNFYQRVIGWQSNLMKEIDGDQRSPRFEMQIDGDHTAAEINQVDGDGSDVPSVWLIHLPVNDLDESLQKVSDHGGKIIQRLDSENTAVIRDPVGVYLALQAG